MSKGKYDVAFLYSSFNNPNFIRRSFFSDPIVLVTNATNTEYRNGITIDQIPSLPFAYSQLWSLDREWILPDHGAYPFSINVLSKIIPYLKTHNWYAFLPLKIIEQELYNGSLIEIPVLGMDIPIKPSYLAFRNDYLKNEALVSFLNVVDRYLEDHQSF